MPRQHSEPSVSPQLNVPPAETWATEVVPRLPADLAAQAQVLGAFQRVRKLASPTDLLRALLVFVLDDLSTRGLGVWAVLLGVGDLSASAWRKRLRRSNAWLGWLLGALLAAEVATAPDLAARGRRIRLIDATRLRQVGGTGDDWRVHWDYELLSGRLGEVVVTDCHQAEGLRHFRLAPGDIAVGDQAYGYRTSVAIAHAAQADVVLRIHPATCPLEDDAGQPVDVVAWLRRHRGTGAAEWTGWCQWQGQRYRVRLLARRLPPDARPRAQRRKHRAVRKRRRQPSAQTLWLASWWLLLTTLDAATWPAADILRLYQARWQIELVFKRFKQLLAGQAIRARTAAAAEATVRALLVAWALQEGVAAAVRAHLATLTDTLARPVSSWLLAGLGLASLRQQVRGTWTLARLHAGLPRLMRFLTSRRRHRREHQETAVRAWLAQHPGILPAPRQAVA